MFFPSAKVSMLYPPGNFDLSSAAANVAGNTTPSTPSTGTRYSRMTSAATSSSAPSQLSYFVRASAIGISINKFRRMPERGVLSATDNLTAKRHQARRDRNTRDRARGDRGGERN